MARAEIVAPGRFSSSFFGSRTQTGTESAFCAPWRCEGTCQLEIVESAVSLFVRDSERSEGFGSELVSLREGPSSWIL